MNASVLSDKLEKTYVDRLVKSSSHIISCQCLHLAAFTWPAPEAVQAASCRLAAMYRSLTESHSSFAFSGSNCTSIYCRQHPMFTRGDKYWEYIPLYLSNPSSNMICPISLQLLYRIPLVSLYPGWVLSYRQRLPRTSSIIFDSASTSIVWYWQRLNVIGSMVQSTGYRVQGTGLFSDHKHSWYMVSFVMFWSNALLFNCSRELNQPITVHHSATERLGFRACSKCNGKANPSRPSPTDESSYVGTGQTSARLTAL